MRSLYAAAQANFKTFTLREMHRQKDIPFAEALNDIRVGNYTPKVAALVDRCSYVPSRPIRIPPLDLLGAMAREALGFLGNGGRAGVCDYALYYIVVYCCQLHRILHKRRTVYFGLVCNLDLGRGIEEIKIAISYVQVKC